MPLVRTLQTNFTSGRIDKTMLGRVETAMYRNGADVLHNWDLQVQGGINRRRGMPFIASLGARYRLLPFIFNETQFDILALTPSTIKVYGVDGTLHQTIGSCPWNTQALVDGLKWDQRGDTVLLTNGFRTKKLLRTAAHTFALSDFEFEVDANDVSKEPFFKFAASDMTLAASSTTGSVTLTTSANHWTTSHVGARVRHKEKQLEITGYTSPTQVTATVKETLTGTAATDEWDESVFSDEQGWPGAVAFHTGRLWLAGPPTLPSHIFGSRSSAFFNFDAGTGLDNEAIGGHAAPGRIGSVRHLVSSEVLFVISDGGLGFIPESDSSPVTPSSFNPKAVIPQGASDVTPVVYDEAIAYAQAKGRAVREVQRDEFTLRVKTRPVSFIATDIVRSVVGSAVQYVQSDRPESLAYFINSDGTVAIYHALRTEDFSAWHSWSTDGRVLSMAAINDKLFACVERQINGVATYSLESYDADYTLDHASRYLSTTAATSFTVDSRFNGHPVHVVSLEENVIANGAFDADTGWTLEAGWAVGSGVLTASGVADAAASITGLTIGKRYRVEGEITAHTSGDLLIDVGYDATLGAISRQTVTGEVGPFSFDMTCEGNTTLYLRKTGSGAFSVDNLVVRELDDNGRLSIKRRYLGTVTPAAGTLTLPSDWTSKHIEVGLSFTPTVRLLPPAENAEDGSILTEPKRIVSVTVSAVDLLSLQVESNPVLLLQITDDLSVPLTPFTGIKEVYNLGWDRLGRITITMPEPLPGTILAVSREVIF